MRIAHVALLFFCAHAVAFEPTRNERWTADLDYLYARIQAVHPNPYTRIPRDVFERQVEETRARIPTQTDAQMAVEFARVVGMLNDGHSSFSLTQAGTGVRRYPIGLRWFSDGLFVTGAPEGKFRLVGAKIISMNGRPVEEVFEAVRPWLSYDTDAWARNQSQNALSTHEILAAAGVVELEGALTLEAERLDGERISEVIELGAVATVGGPVAARPILPLSRRQNSQDYWFEWIDNERTLYIQYTQCREHVLLPMTAFADEIIAFAHANPPERWVFDVRDNPGGSSAPFLKLLTILRSRMPAPTKGVYGIISKRTMSSGVLAANDMRRAGILLIGEPTGGRVCWFGGPQAHTLPYSRLSFSISSFLLGDPATGPALTPDVPVDFNGADYFRYRDPYLDEALRHDPGTQPEQTLPLEGKRRGGL